MIGVTWGTSSSSGAVDRASHNYEVDIIQYNTCFVFSESEALLVYFILLDMDFSIYSM